MKRYKILIVDDNVRLGEELEQFLNTRGPFIARLVDNFHEAEGVALEMLPDLIVLDLWDEATNSLKGEDLAARFLDLPRLVSVPIIYYTATKAIAQLGNIVGASDYQRTGEIILPATRPNAKPSRILTKGRTEPSKLLDKILEVLKS